jgi:hypothetical protein
MRSEEVRERKEEERERRRKREKEPKWKFVNGVPVLLCIWGMRKMR